MTTLDLPCFTREVLPSWLNISKVTSMWVLAIPAKAPHWFEYTDLPNAVISATFCSNKVTQAVFTQFSVVFSHSLNVMLL